MRPIECPADLVHRVTFRDYYGARDRDDWPVHMVASSKGLHHLEVEFDGTPVGGIIAADVRFGRGQATILSLQVDPEYVTPPCWIDGVYQDGAIDGHPVLVPSNGGDKPESEWYFNERTGLVVCTMYASGIAFE